MGSVHRVAAVIPIDHEVEVFDSSVDVGLFSVDVSDFHLLACARHELHDTNGAYGTLGSLIQAGLPSGNRQPS
ncbi:MAG: hypothetical protein WCE52_00295 [Candidatus Acidiferrum sp.]